MSPDTMIHNSVDRLICRTVAIVGILTALLLDGCVTVPHSQHHRDEHNSTQAHTQTIVGHYEHQVDSALCPPGMVWLSGGEFTMGSDARKTQRTATETKFEQLRDVIGKHIAGTNEKLLVFTDPTQPGTQSNRCTQGPWISWSQGRQDNEEGSVRYGCATPGMSVFVMV